MAQDRTVLPNRDSSAPVKEPPAANAARRRLLSWLLGTSVGGLFASIVYPVVRFMSPPEMPEAATNQVEAGATDDFEFDEKQFKMVRFGSEPVIVVKVAEGDFRAFSATCTHLDCTVDFRPDRQLLWCWCHNGVYDLNGRNIGGPPPRPLDPFQVHLVDQGPGKAQTIVVSKA